MNLDVLEERLERQRTEHRLPDPRTRQLIRRQLGVPLATIAEAVGVSRATVCRWESGDREPRGEHAALYLAVLERMKREIAARVAAQ